MPPTTHDPLTWFGSFNGFFHECDDVVPSRGGSKVETHEGLAKTHEVPVSIDETWDRKGARQIDDFRLSPDVHGYFFVAPHRKDASALDGQRLDMRSSGFHRQDFAAPKHQIRFLLRRRATKAWDET